MVYEFRKRRFELSKMIEKWWQHQDDFIDFKKELTELKLLARKCPYIYYDEFDREISEIEISLREDFLIE
jgi:hypothetical protein